MGAPVGLVCTILVIVSASRRLTVKLMLPLPVSTAHATLLNCFFLHHRKSGGFTSRSWSEPRNSVDEKGTLPVRYLSIAAAATIFLQLILGHSSPFALPGQPLPSDLVLAHIGGAIAVTIVLATTALISCDVTPGEVSHATRTIALALLALQLMLGVGAYLTRMASPDRPRRLIRGGD